MAMKKRWLTWVLDESVKASDEAPWHRKTPSVWKDRLQAVTPKMDSAQT